jgi:hypothetical protein
VFAAASRLPALPPPPALAPAPLPAEVRALRVPRRRPGASSVGAPAVVLARATELPPRPAARPPLLARAFLLYSLVLRAGNTGVGLFNAPVRLVVPPAVVENSMRAAPAQDASTHGQVLQLLMKPLLLPAKDLALEHTLGAPSTAVDVVVGEPLLLGAAVLSAPDVGGCSCGGGSGGSGGGGGLTGNLLLCLRC